jgi:hypothetical protein
MPIALIVCHDNRAEKLAEVLSNRFQVYQGDHADFNLWQPGGFRFVEDPGTVPKNFDCLFYHTGMGDPQRIPPDRTYTREFAFSGGVMAVGPIKERPSALAILAPFRENYCPIHKTELPELLAFVGDPKRKPPSFCSLPSETYRSDALCILLEGYLCVQASADQSLEERFKGTFEACGWLALEPDFREALRGDLKPLADQVARGSWWLRSGFSKLIETQGWDGLERGFETEMAPMPEAVRSLLEAIRTGGAIEPQRAVEAYTALSVRRGGEG